MNGPRQLLDHALQLHGSGRLGDAEKIYLSMLADEPGQADALHYLGVIGLQTGRIDDAIGLMQQAVNARPDYVDAISNLGNALQAARRFDEAATHFERALSLAPESAPTLANLGGALYQLGRYRDAAERFEQALSLQPELAEARRSYADALVKLGRPGDALREINRAIKDGPQSLAMHVSLGNILRASGRIGDSIACFEEILRHQPNLPKVRGSLANFYRECGRYDEALAEYGKALEQEPNSPETYFNLGMISQNLGDERTALEHYRKSVELDADYAKGWHGLSTVMKQGFTDNEVERILELQRMPDASAEDRMRLGFGLGKHFERRQRIEEASEQFLLANRLRREEFDYDILIDLQAIDNLLQAFDTGFFDKWSGVGLDDAKSIFIVGMPRSGTTLVEQILASHSRVYGAGELMLLIGAIVEVFPFQDGVDYSDPLANATPDQFRTVARKYLDALPVADADFITDKLPHNFLNIGMIRVLFPNAKIIHCTRDPRDTCFSMFKNFFGAHGHFYAYDLQELARYYLGYQKLMAHWESVQPGVIHTVPYESMIDDQEATTRALIDACGLDWEDECLRFHQHQRPVTTLSSEQVRQPIYRGSLQAWKPYEKMLQPLLQILDSARN